MAEYRNKPIMDLANRIDQEFGAEASRHVLGLYEEANAWHRTASNLSRGCAEIQSKLDEVRNKCRMMRDAPCEAYDHFAIGMGAFAKTILDALEEPPK